MLFKHYLLYNILENLFWRSVDDQFWVVKPSVYSQKQIGGRGGKRVGSDFIGLT